MLLSIWKIDCRVSHSPDKADRVTCLFILWVVAVEASTGVGAWEGQASEEQMDREQRQRKKN